MKVENVEEVEAIFQVMAVEDGEEEGSHGK